MWGNIKLLHEFNTGAWVKTLQTNNAAGIVSGRLKESGELGLKSWTFLFRTCSSLLCIFDILPCFQGGVLLRFKVQATTVALDSHGENMQVFVWDWIILVECVWPNVNLLGLAGHLKYAVSLPGYRIFTNSLALLTFFLKYRRVFLEQWTIWRR